MSNVYTWEQDFTSDDWELFKDGIRIGDITPAKGAIGGWKVNVQFPPEHGGYWAPTEEKAKSVLIKHYEKFQGEPKK